MCGYNCPIFTVKRGFCPFGIFFCLFFEIETSTLKQCKKFFYKCAGIYIAAWDTPM